MCGHDVAHDFSWLTFAVLAPDLLRYLDSDTHLYLNELKKHNI